MQRGIYLRSLFSGYGMIAVGGVCSLISVPLVLRYLSTEEYGLWAVVFQVGGYFSLVDAGISSSIGRLLIDHHTERPSRKYGAVFFGGLLILCVLAAIVTLLALAFLPFLPCWLGMGKNLQTPFLVLVLIQILIVAVNLPLRSVGQSILSTSRYDLLHYCLSGSLIANLAILWAALASGAGIYSIAWAGIGGLGVSIFTHFLAAGSLGCLPIRAEWALPSRGEWMPLIAFARDVVFVQVGNALVFSTQTVIISSTLGLAAAATWAAGSKMFFLLFQLTGKIAEVAGPRMAAMHVSGAHGRLEKTICAILAATVAAAMCGALFLVTINASFVQIWTGGKIVWPKTADLFLGLWLILASVAAALTARALAGKQLSHIRHIYLLEGIAGTLAAFCVAPHFGIPGVAASFAIACLLFSFRVTVVDTLLMHKRGK